MNPLKPLKFLYAVTVPMTARAFFTAHLRALVASGKQVHLVSDPEPPSVVAEVVALSGVTAHAVPMQREISLRRDPLSLLGMYRLLRQVRPDVFNFSTPKAGLLGAVAGAVAGVPLRVYVLHGLRSESTALGQTKRLRPLLRSLERLTMACAHEVVCVSQSNRELAIKLKLVPAHKIRVLGQGSAAGLPTSRYAQPDLQAVSRARQELVFPPQTPVVGYVGRLVMNKGIAELLQAWTLVQAARPDAALLLVGEMEAANPLPSTVLEALEGAQNVRRVAYESDMSRLYPLMNVFTLPSSNEGLGMVLLEAAAAGVPLVVPDSVGVRDTLLPNVSGLKVPPNNAAALAEGLLALLSDPARAQAYGQAGQRWVTEHFDEAVMDAHWEQFYQEAWERRTTARHHYSDQLKRAVDVAVAATGLVVFSPLLVGLALLVAVKLGRPVLFRQSRPGQFGHSFTLLKFRSMTDAVDARGQLMPDAERLTSFGRWLRSTSLDELPELINVLRGEMSLVGPRPLLKQYLPLYTAVQARRHEVRPGLTGLAQVSGRNTLTWEDKFKYDVEYVDQRSFWLDIQILLSTVSKVIQRSDINFADGTTEAPFTGSTSQTNLA